MPKTKEISVKTFHDFPRDPKMTDGWEHMRAHRRALGLPVSDDWSSIMTKVHNSLKRAEDELRLTHVHWNHVSNAKQHILEAQYSLHDLLKWVENQ